MTDKKQTILVVDDETTNIKVLRELLKADYTVLVATNGEKALQIAFSSNPPDLILTDIMMPDMDGYEVCRRLKADNRAKGIPVIFITAKNEVKDETKGFELGAVDFIIKPFSPSIVNARVHTHIALKSACQEAEKARKSAEETNRQMMQSIAYARSIQQSLMPSSEELQADVPDSFILWMPRDIVGGDIVFFDHSKEGIWGAVADCTGHGVPGAFMSMLASSGMRHIIKEQNCKDPALILKKLNTFVKKTLRQDTKKSLSDDGMDVSLWYIDSSMKTLTFAGARLSLIYVRDGQAAVIKGDRQSIGYKRADINFDYTNHVISIQGKMFFYLHTDGFTDQIGGVPQRKFGKKRLIQKLEEIYHLPFIEQRKILLTAFEKHLGENDRLDDVSIVGFNLDQWLCNKT